MSTMPFKPSDGITPPPGLSAPQKPIASNIIHLLSDGQRHVEIGSREEGINTCVIRIYNYAGIVLVELTNNPLVVSGDSVKAIIFGKELYDCKLTSGEYKIEFTLGNSGRQITKTLQYRVV
jgi:hypothetical protein